MFIRTENYFFLHTHSHINLCIPFVDPMLRSAAAVDLFSMKHLNHHHTMKSSSFSKRLEKVHVDSTSSSPLMHDAMMAPMIPVTMTPFEVASSFNSSFKCAKDIRGAFCLSSIIKIDGPATQALEHSLRLSKRRLVVENSTPVDSGNIATSKKRTKRNENSSTTQSKHIPLLNDWSNVYNCLISSVPVDETKPTIMNEPFPGIEYTFDDADILLHDPSQPKTLVQSEYP